jgi:anti-sigma regulatory factor (Ser/Thr protein kinase)
MSPTGGRDDGDSVHLVERTFDVDSTTPARARETIEVLEGSLTQAEFDDLQLLVSEVATNAVRHGRRGPIRLTVSRSPRSVRVAVTDRGEGFAPGQVEPSMYQGSGWGLFLVQQLAGDWGVTRDDGTTVWFELPVDLEGAVRLENRETRR